MHNKDLPHLERAIAIAVKAHAGQKDKTDAPYILHPIRVMVSVKTEEEMMAAILHDVVENTSWTLDHLRDEGIPGEVVEAVDFLTNPKDGSMTYEEYVQKTKKNPIALAVKLADITDNSDPERILKLPPAKQKELSEKYARALEILKAD